MVVVVISALAETSTVGDCTWTYAEVDPTNEKDVFKASITIVNNEVQISFTPELTDEQKNLRKYTTWGKKSILDENWVEVESGKESNYNFFKVSVEML